MSLNVTAAQQAAFIQLFKSAVDSVSINGGVSPMEQIAHGILFVDGQGSVRHAPQDAYTAAVKEYGAEVIAFNKTFHKSFKEMAYGDPLTLLLQQMMNYMSTYGRESIGLTAGNYVPLEVLEIPADAFNIKRITVIRMLPLMTLKGKLNEYLKTLTAPNDRIRNAVQQLFPFVTNTPDEIKSFEIMVMYCDYKRVYPAQPISGLRYLIYKVTGVPMIIKNRRTIETIKNRSAYSPVNELPARVFMANLPGYAGIFLRYKPLFLAFKKYPNCARLVNHMRRMADTYHKPLPDTAVQNFINLMLQGKYLKALGVLDKASNRDLVKIINSCSTRASTESLPAVYTVRNGRMFVKDGGIQPLNPETANVYVRCIQECMKALYTRLNDQFAGKTFVLPDDVDYAVPTTEKQMMGTIPYGTGVVIPAGRTNLTVGVHWTNNKTKHGESRVDIDLHAHSVKANFGWNSYWRDGTDVVYSGDNTNAPIAQGGAAEAFWVKLGQDDIVFDVSLFSGLPETEFKFFLTGNDRNDMHRDFTFDASKLLATPLRLGFNGQHGMTLGMLTEDRFYIYGGALQTGIVPSANYESAIAGMKNIFKSKMHMSTFLRAMGAWVMTPMDLAQLKQDDPEAAAQVISLMPEDLTPGTLLNLVDGKVE